MELEGRVAVVTGAARGIGRATACALARAGVRAVALADLDVGGLEETRGRVDQLGAEGLAVPTDVASASSLPQLMDETERHFGRLDILHNNAGIGEGPGGWPEIPTERSVAVVDVNLRGVVLGTQLALAAMRRSGGGAIVNTASGGAFLPLPRQAVYAATKAGVVHFTRSCTGLLESHGVRVNCVCPGVTDTPLLRESGAQGIAPWLAAHMETIEIWQPEDVAAAVLDLIRDDARNGEALELRNPARKT